MSEKNLHHGAIGFLWLILSLICFFFFSHASRALASPTVDSITISDSSGGASTGDINLVDNSTKEIYIHGGFSDLDGCDDVQNGGDVELVLYRSGVVEAESCTTDPLNCYKASITGGCSISNCTTGLETNANYECNVSLQYYADATDAGTYATDVWTAYIRATDSGAATGQSTSNTEVNSLVGIQVGGGINYGALELGATSTEDASVIVQNTGNRSLDINLSGEDMSCDVGTIDVSQQRFSVTSTVVYADMTALATSTQRAQLSLAKQLSAGVYSTSSLNFKLVMPTSSLAGVCSGLVNFNALVDN